MAPLPSKLGSLLLVRHGQTEYSAAGRRTGLVDVPLDPEGERQAQALAPELATHEFAEVWCSPLGALSRPLGSGG